MNNNIASLIHQKPSVDSDQLRWSNYNGHLNRRKMHLQRKNDDQETVQYKPKA